MNDTLSLLITAAVFMLVLFLAGWAEKTIVAPLWAIASAVFLALIAYSLGKPLVSALMRRRTRKKGAYYLINNLLWKPELVGETTILGAPMCNWCQAEVLILPGKAAYHKAVYSQCPSCGAINEFSMSYPQLLKNVEGQLPEKR
jgi:hypothetical protein